MSGDFSTSAGGHGPGDTTNRLPGASRDVVQARDVHGDIHFHAGSGGLPEVRRPYQLPAAVADFTDRALELARLDTALPRAAAGGSRVWTVAGPPGVGKTALVVHWARAARAAFPDGQLYENLHGYDAGPPSPPDQVLDRLLRSLGVAPGAIPGDVEAQAALYRSLVDGREMLMVFDNAKTIEQVRPLLPGSPTCTVVITSRNGLPGLVAREGARRMSLDVLPPGEALNLLGRVVGPERVAAEPDTAAELVRLCGCLPLALRIAAERVTRNPHTTLADLIGELADPDRLDGLAAPEDDTSAVRVVFSWSYAALPPEAARMFRLLGLHDGPEPSTAAAAALAGTTLPRARRVLEVLTGAYLLDQPARDRYRLHDLLRFYAAERAREEEPQAERAAAVDRLLAWYLHTAAAAADLLPARRRVPLPSPGAPPPGSFPSQDAALEWCDAERENLLAAVRTAAASGRHVVAWQLPLVLGTYFNLRKDWPAWIETHRIGLAAARASGEVSGAAWTLISLGTAYRDTGEYQKAMACYERALPVFPAMDDRLGEASAQNNLAHVYRELGRYDDAVAGFATAREIYRELAQPKAEGRALSNLGDAHTAAGRPREALACLQEALALLREAGDRHAEGFTLHNLAVAHLDAGAPGEAVAAAGQSLEARRATGNRWGEARTLAVLGDAHHRRGELSAARAAWQRAATLFDGVDDAEAARVRARLGESGRPGREPPDGATGR